MTFLMTFLPLIVLITLIILGLIGALIIQGLGLGDISSELAKIRRILEKGKNQ